MCSMHDEIITASYAYYTDDADLSHWRFHCRFSRKRAVALRASVRASTPPPPPDVLSQPSWRPWLNWNSNSAANDAPPLGRPGVIATRRRPSCASSASSANSTPAACRDRRARGRTRCSVRHQLSDRLPVPCTGACLGESSLRCTLSRSVCPSRVPRGRIRRLRRHQVRSRSSHHRRPTTALLCLGRRNERPVRREHPAQA